jgi:hypothetical protein
MQSAMAPEMTHWLYQGLSNCQGPSAADPSVEDGPSGRRAQPLPARLRGHHLFFELGDRPLRRFGSLMTSHSGGSQLVVP